MKKSKNNWIPIEKDTPKFVDERIYTRYREGYEPCMQIVQISDPVIVSTDFDEIRIMNYCHVVSTDTYYWWDVKTDDCGCLGRVIAWMPEPNAYKKGMANEQR